ncbi:MAG: hypothetical protein AVDCRST_MAG85-3181, partial [uncultured Solirubrobacteraceae bacterium]
WSLRARPRGPPGDGRATRTGTRWLGSPSSSPSTATGSSAWPSRCSGRPARRPATSSPTSCCATPSGCRPAAPRPATRRPISKGSCASGASIFGAGRRPRRPCPRSCTSGRACRRPGRCSHWPPSRSPPGRPSRCRRRRTATHAGCEGHTAARAPQPVRRPARGHPPGARVAPGDAGSAAARPARGR